jgi:hypothetical protein
LWLGLVLINFVPLYGLFDGQYHLHDLSETVFHAREFVLGKVPHRDAFNHHFSGYIVFFALFEALFGLTPHTVILLSGVFNLVNAVLSYAACYRLTRDRSMAYLAAFLVVTLGWVPGWQGRLFNMESYLLPFLNLLIWLTVCALDTGKAPYLLGAWFVSGLLTTFDQRAIVFLALPGYVQLIHKPFRTVSLMLCSVAAYLTLPLTGLFALFYARALDQFIFQTLIFPFQYRNATIAAPIYKRLSALMYLAAKQERLVVFIGLAGFIAFLGSHYERRIKGLWVLLAVCASLFVCIGGRVFPNYLIILVPALLIPMALLPTTLRVLSPWQRYVSAALVLVGALSMALAWSATPPPSHATMPPLRQVARLIEAQTHPDEPVLVWGYCPQLYLYANRRSGFRDMGLLSVAGGEFHYSAQGEANAVPAMLEEFRQYLSQRPPKVIVSSDTASSSVWSTASRCIFPRPQTPTAAHLAFFQTFLETHYEVIDRIMDGPMKLAVYLRKDHP